MALLCCDCTQDDKTPLLLAVEEGQLEVVRLMLELGADKEANDRVRAPHATAAALCVGARRVRQSAGRVQPCMRSVPHYLSRLGCLLAALRRGAAFVRSRAEWQDATALGGKEWSSGGRTAAAGARREQGGQRFRARPTRHSRCALRRSAAHGGCACRSRVLARCSQCAVRTEEGGAARAAFRAASPASPQAH